MLRPWGMRLWRATQDETGRLSREPSAGSGQKGESVMGGLDSVVTVVLIGLVLLLSGLKILREYERAVIFRLGRLVPSRGPGVIYVIPLVERMVRVALRTITLEVPPQDVITRDNVSLKVSAVLYFRVLDPNRATIEIENYLFATSQLAQTTTVLKATALYKRFEREGRLVEESLGNNVSATLNFLPHIDR